LTTEAISLDFIAKFNAIFGINGNNFFFQHTLCSDTVYPILMIQSNFYVKESNSTSEIRNTEVELRESHSIAKAYCRNRKRSNCKYICISFKILPTTVTTTTTTIATIAVKLMAMILSQHLRQFADNKFVNRSRNGDIFHV